MLSRRLLRVKVMQTVYGHFRGGDSSLQQAEKELFHSISKSHELYHLLLLLILDVRDLAEKRIENGLNKKRPTYEELHPNRKFINNKVIQQLRENRQLLKYIETTGLSWKNNEQYIKDVYKHILDSELYQQYMQSDDDSYESDRKFVAKLYEKVIGQYLPLYALLEEESIFWNDEAEFVVSIVVKTIKEFKEENGEEQALQKEFKDEEDREFVKTLIRKAILNNQDYQALIRKFSRNWDLERVAYLDIVLMQIAIAEFLEFPQIPVKVTLNEYIEIAKHYSTPKSGTFINGILDKVITHLKKENQLEKIVDRE
ncbi:transcription antitermination factor NusB [Anaerophaga thermohalophila]|uniref:transcription antitermination factor NusB n=1 Tax=Anaerophaga thermohalophila TaxID=177400 RepID=UPI000237CA38|nr:transcription antitermination factor NusB [Anaerophaga thermohalophila]MDI3520522.1 transcription antitermination protein NusB [Anaerophaga sp.]